MPKHKSEDYKLSAVNYYLTENNNQLQTCKIFKCSRCSLMRNEILYRVPYQHFTNAIENWFSVMKSKLQKKEGLTYNNLKQNIQNVIEEISKTTFTNIFKSSYERNIEKIKNKTRN